MYNPNYNRQFDFASVHADYGTLPRCSQLAIPGKGYVQFSITSDLVKKNQKDYQVLVTPNDTGSYHTNDPYSKYRSISTLLPSVKLPDVIFDESYFGDNSSKIAVVPITNKNLPSFHGILRSGALYVIPDVKGSGSFTITPQGAH